MTSPVIRACHQMPVFMLRTALLLFFLLGVITSELQAAPAETTATTWIHRRKPTAGNYRPVYKTYRGSGRQHRGGFRLFKRRHSTALHKSKARHHRGTL